MLRVKQPNAIQTLSMFLLLVLMGSVAGSQTSDSRVDAKKFFTESNNTAVEIGLPDSKTLVFKSEEGDLMLNGRSLSIDVNSAEVNGDVVIWTFSNQGGQETQPKARAGPDGRSGGVGQRGSPGQDGENGNAGVRGLSGSAITLRIGKLSGHGRLLIYDNGAPGGLGQQGGDGGKGGDGGVGDHRSCHGEIGAELYEWLSQGGVGGDGGNGGSGGDGGRGGDGGNISYLKILTPEIGKHLIFVTEGGTGGHAAIGGLAGKAGAGGSYGVNNVLGCSDDRPPGSLNARAGILGKSGKKGDEGLNGASGSIVCLGCGDKNS